MSIIAHIVFTAALCLSLSQMKGLVIAVEYLRSRNNG